jgi:antitoxin component of MazEF toxin-antitoxin module
LIEIIANENSAVITVPMNELEKFGLNVGDEIEVLQNENNEIVLRPKQNDRKKRILEATREIIEERRPALVELGKGHE